MSGRRKADMNNLTGLENGEWIMRGMSWNDPYRIRISGKAVLFAIAEPGIGKS